MTKTRTKQLVTLTVGLVLWFWPAPEGVTPQAWHLFAIFITTILAVIVDAMPILTASLIALSASVLTGTLEPAKAYSGFGSGFILLIVIAFLIGRGVVNSGLGNRIAYTMVRFFGRSTLGLGYSMVATDVAIAAAFPSNTARSGVLYPIVLALSKSNGSEPDGTRHKMGAFLMLNSMAGLSLSSALWLTAMAANPAGVAMAVSFDVEISFLSWLIAASVPCAIAIVVVPAVLYKLFPPEVKATPHAPAEAKLRLQEMGPISRNEWITGVTFVLMVVGWALSGTLGIDVTAVAFLGLAVLMLAGIFTLDDMNKSGDALGTLIWFAILYTLSTSLDELGFMAHVGTQIGSVLDGLSWPVLYSSLILIYVLIHYLFVSQTAHLLALFVVFMDVSRPHVPPALMAYMLLFTTNLFALVTPQGSSANVIFAGSGYLTTREIYKYGGVVTLVNMVIFLGVGTPWILWVT